MPAHLAKLAKSATLALGDTKEHANVEAKNTTTEAVGGLHSTHMSS
jgi:hypothetical protein